MPPRKRKPEQAKEPAPVRQAPSAEQVFALFTDQIVDLDVFTQGATRYTVEDVAGRPRTYELPNDPPFPLALAFHRAHDRYYQTMIQVARANRKSEQAMLDKIQTAWSDLIGREATEDRPERPGAFLDLVKLRQPDVTVNEFRAELGGVVLENWMETVVMRLHLTRLAGESNSALALLASALKEPSGSPKANGGVSSRSSGDSVG